MAKKQRDQLVFIEDILDCIQRIQAYVKDLCEKDFEENTEKQDAVIRRLEIIGEAVKNISVELKAQYPDIPWREMAGMRDVVIHQYFGVSIGLIWRVATSEIPKLQEQFEAILRDYPTAF